MSIFSQINLRYSLLLFFAATTAFALAVFLKIPNPYWAVMPVWILVQKSREEVFEKGFWRIVGTALGALLSVLIAFYVPSTFLKLVLISLILALTSGFTHAFRGLSGYGLQMLGITVGAIVLPAIFHPEIVESLSWARFLCTVLGVITIGVFTFWYLPQSPVEQLYLKLQKFHEKLKTNSKAKGELVSELADLQNQSENTFTFFSSKNLNNKFESYFIKAMDFLLNKRTLIPEIFSIEENEKRGMNLRYSFYSDLSLRVTISIFAIGLLGSVIGIYSGWRFGHLLAMGFCVLTAVLGGMPIPRKIAPHMLAGVFLGAATAVVYRLFIQQYLTESWEVILWTTPILFVGAMLRTHEKYKFASVDFNMIFLLAGQVGLAPVASTWDILESTLPILIAGLVVTSLHIYFPRPHHKLAQKHLKKYFKTKSTKALFEYLYLLRLNDQKQIDYEEFVDKFKES